LTDPDRSRAHWALFGLGLAISLLMLARAQVAGDGISLLSRGWLLAAKDIWVPLGNPVASSAGGYVPGGLTALVVGLPLKLWMHPRAPVVLILICHVVAYLMLDRVVGEALGARARLVFAVVYWLNPWRLYQSAWLDNSNYVFLTGALHTWACYRQRHTSSFLHSALLVGAVGLTLQLHVDAMILVIAAVLLWLRGGWRPHWGGVAVGAAVTVGALVPFFLEVAREPRLLPGSEGTIGRNLVQIWPPFKGLLYWFRYASLDCSKSMWMLDFTPAFGARADALLMPLFSILRRLASVTVIVSVVANLWLWRRRRASPSAGTGDPTSARTWLGEYALWTFVACFIANALSPSVVTWWHNLIALHAAVLPLVLGADALLASPRTPWVRRGMAAWAALSVILLLGMAFASDQYRQGGRDPVEYVLESDHEMVRDLGLADCCGVSLDPEKGAWPRKNSYFYVHYVRPFLIPPPAPDDALPEIRWD